jgi:nucleoid DNA-binding protein
MQKTDIAKKMARRSGVSPAEAADRLDLVVQQMIASLRKGEETKLPGLGRFSIGDNGQVVFEREGRAHD